jgi:hypothetical protein
MTEVLVHMAGMLTPRTCMQIIQTQHFIASVVLLLALILLLALVYVSSLVTETGGKLNIFDAHQVTKCLDMHIP